MGTLRNLSLWRRSSQEELCDLLLDFRALIFLDAFHFHFASISDILKFHTRVLRQSLYLGMLCRFDYETTVVHGHIPDDVSKPAFRREVLAFYRRIVVLIKVFPMPPVMRFILVLVILLYLVPRVRNVGTVAVILHGFEGFI